MGCTISNGLAQIVVLMEQWGVCDVELMFLSLPWLLTLYSFPSLSFTR